MAPAALDGFTEVVKTFGVEFVDELNFEATPAVASKLLLTYRESLLLVAPEKVPFTYIKNGITRVNGFFEADDLGVALAGSEEDVEIAALKKLKTVPEFKEFFTANGISFAKNAGENKCVELFLENKEALDEEVVKNFLGE